MGKRLLFIFALMIVAASAQSSAQDRNVSSIDLERATPQKLADEKAIDVIAAYEKSVANTASPLSLPMRYAARIRYSLATLFYPVDLSSTASAEADEKLKEQVRQFEIKLSEVGGSAGKFGVYKDLTPNVAADGSLTWYEFNELERLADLSRVQPVLAGRPEVSVFLHRIDNFGYASSQGSWEIVGDQIAFPLNVARVKCTSLDGLCRVNEIRLVAPSERGLAASSSTIVLSLYSAISDDEYLITSWTDNVIEARSEPPVDGPECRFTTLTLIASTNTVTMVTQDTGADCKLSDGQSIPRLVQPRVSVLKPTSAVFSGYFDAVLGHVEKFHGPLAATAYQRPYTGRAR